jgi:hypothetical protein
MLIFGSFPDKTKAQAFASAVRGRIFTSYANADASDPFPFQFALPLVHVERVMTKDGRINLEAENKLRQLARQHGGALLGT